ncbi:hypothetical protein BD560DRAFT_411652 [Blakeslea trispora]|nr:hypothetical protein BD560DRAFT_411652 [Blakeslea trispora]
MDTVSIHSFSTHVPFKQPIVITHYISMVVAFLGCYPLLLTQQIRRQKVYIFSASLLFASIGFISGYFIQLEQSLTTIVFRIFALLLLCLVLMQVILAIYRSSTMAERFPQLHTIMTKCFRSLPKWVDLVLGWTILAIAFSYLILATLVFTESCVREDQQAQCLMPVAMGAGFLFYGTLVLLHLLAILKLPRPSTPEYYEGIILTFWGFCSLLLSDTPILGTEWRAINLGLLWFTGGIFSLSLSLQTWIPSLREKNIINALIVCLTGRAIVRGLTQVDEPYAAEVHTMLGYVLMIGAMCRLTQIVFRKSPADSLPHHMFQQNADTANLLDEDDEEEAVVDEPKQTHQKKCKHRFIFASLTLVSGILASLLSVCSGILLMGANVGWIRYMRFYIEDSTTYVNISLAAAFLWSAYVFGLCTAYKNLKKRNAIHQYEYMQLENPVHHTHSLYPHDESESRQQWIHVNTNLPQHSVVTMSTTSPTLSEHPLVSSPTMAAAETIPFSNELSIQTRPPETIPNEKTIRPSEYRAKRRSLLVQSPVAQANAPMTRARSSSMYGVGGVLPDEFVLKAATDASARRSWRSSASSTLGSASIESIPNSPTSDSHFKVFSNSSQEEIQRCVYKEKQKMG